MDADRAANGGVQRAVVREHSGVVERAVEGGGRDHAARVEAAVVGGHRVRADAVVGPPDRLAGQHVQARGPNVGEADARAGGRRGRAHPTVLRGCGHRDGPERDHHQGGREHRASHRRRTL
jgi:hypothetical protein